MIWDNIIGHKKAIDYLKAYSARKNLAHAYLFYGSESIGKSLVARAFAATLLCQSHGCGQCPCCLKVLTDKYPDVYFIEPEGNFIVIEQIHELQRQVVLKPFEASGKAFLINDAETMTLEAANSFLKTLEEPPRDVYFILVTANMDSLLPTIVSRCQKVSFTPLSTKTVREALISNFSLSREEAEFLARFSEGIIGRAIKMINTDYGRRRDEMISLIEKISEYQLEEVIYIIELIFDKIKGELEAIRLEIADADSKMFFEDLDTQVSQSSKKRLEMQKKRKFSKMEMNLWDEILEIFSIWYRDLLILKCNLPAHLVVNSDKSKNLSKKVKEYSQENLIEILNIILETKRVINRRANPYLAMQTMLLNIAGIV